MMLYLKLIGKILSPCNVDVDCSAAVPFSNCTNTNNKCLCNTGYLRSSDLKTCSKSMYLAHI